MDYLVFIESYSLLHLLQLYIFLTFRGFPLLARYKTTFDILFHESCMRFGRVRESNQRSSYQLLAKPTRPLEDNCSISDQLRLRSKNLKF